MPPDKKEKGLPSYVNPPSSVRQSRRKFAVLSVLLVATLGWKALPLGTRSTFTLKDLEKEQLFLCVEQLKITYFV